MCSSSSLNSSASSFSVRYSSPITPAGKAIGTPRNERIGGWFGRKSRGSRVRPQIGGAGSASPPGSAGRGCRARWGACRSPRARPLPSPEVMKLSRVRRSGFSSPTATYRAPMTSRPSSATRCSTASRSSSAMSAGTSRMTRSMRRCETLPSFGMSDSIPGPPVHAGFNSPSPLPGHLACVAIHRIVAATDGSLCGDHAVRLVTPWPARSEARSSHCGRDRGVRPGRTASVTRIRGLPGVEIVAPRRSSRRRSRRSRSLTAPPNPPPRRPDVRYGDPSAQRSHPLRAPRGQTASPVPCWRSTEPCAGSACSPPRAAS